MPSLRSFTFLMLFKFITMTDTKVSNPIRIEWSRDAKFPKGSTVGCQNPSAILLGGSNIARVFCQGVPKTGVAKFPMTPVSWKYTHPVNMGILGFSFSLDFRDPFVIIQTIACKRQQRYGEGFTKFTQLHEVTSQFVMFICCALRARIEDGTGSRLDSCEVNSLL